MSQIIVLARENTKEHQELIVEKLGSEKGVDITIQPSEGRDGMGIIPKANTLIIGCKVEGCNKSITSTKGETVEEKFASLVANHWGHIRKSHPEVNGEQQTLIKGLGEAIATLIWIDQCVKPARGKQGVETMKIIEEAQGQAEHILDLYFEGGEEEDEGDEDGDEEILDGEGVIEETEQKGEEGETN